MLLYQRTQPRPSVSQILFESPQAILTLCLMVRAVPRVQTDLAGKSELFAVQGAHLCASASTYSCNLTQLVVLRIEGHPCPSVFRALSKFKSGHVSFAIVRLLQSQRRA